MTDKYRIFLNEPDLYHGIDFSRHPQISHAYTREDTVPYNDIDILAVGLKNVIDDNYISRFLNLKYIISNTTAVDHIKINRQVEVIHLDSVEIEGVSATAEFTLALMLSLVRKIPFINPEKIDDRVALRGTQLKGLQLGIVGLGRIGKKMARYAEALEMKWMAVDKESSSLEKKELFRKSDLITLHMPLNENTIGYIGAEEFSHMKKHPYLVNSSRPQIINKEALIEALDQGLIKGLAMDFLNYNADYQNDSDLQKYLNDRVLLTPHIAGNTYESIYYTANIVIKKLLKKISENGALNE